MRWSEWAALAVLPVALIVLALVTTDGLASWLLVLGIVALSGVLAAMLLFGYALMVLGGTQEWE